MAMAMAASYTRQRLSDANPDGVKYFMNKLLFQIYEHFDNQNLVDVTFKLTNPTALVTAHRLILSSASPYFRELFKSDAGAGPLIEIADIDGDTFERLITFCYTGATLITIENVYEMLKAALTLQLDDAVNNCVNFIIEHITDYTLRRAYALDAETECALLHQKIFEYEIKNFMNVTQSEEFLQIDASKLQAFLECENLNVRCEEDVFEVVKRWYEHDAFGRERQLPQLVSCLRLTQFDMNFLLNRVQPLPGCELIALNALSWISHPTARSKLALKYTNRRGTADESLVVVNIKDKDCATIYQYSKPEDSWHKYIDISIDISEPRIIFMDDNLIFIGGERNGYPTNEVCSWNFKTETCKLLPAMEQSRHQHSIVILNENIYAIGGKDGRDTFFSSAEVYNASNGWRSIRNMIIPRAEPAAIASQGKIFVMGGYCNECGLKSVECYDPKTNTWNACADMNEVHDAPGATVHNGQIFVLGGYTGDTSSSTVERYDIQRNEWTKICSLSIARYRIGCISIDNELWSIGGDTNSVSIYDEQNYKWIDKEPIPFEGACLCFTVPRHLLGSE